MSYTNPNGQPQGKPLHNTNKIREALIAELGAINSYTNHIANSNIEEINEAWYEILKDEKKHYGWFLNLLRKYDSVEYQKYQENKDKKEGPKDPMQTYEPDYEKQIILNNIREDIKGELEAVILYEQHYIEIRDRDIKDVFLAVSTEEKEHAEILTQLVLKYDPDNYDSLD